VLPVKLIALKSYVSAFAFTFFVFYVTPRVESLSYLTLSKPWQAHHKNISPRIIAIHINAINVIKNPIASIINAFMVDLAGVEPASRMPYFTTLSIQGLQQFLT